MNLYQEPESTGNSHRKIMRQEVSALIRKRQRQADKERKAFFSPDFSSAASYEASLPEYRWRLRKMLGWPLTEKKEPPPNAELKKIADDDLGTIYRTWIDTLPGLRTYGIYFRPKGRGPFPLVIAQHGGGGTPELISNFFGSANYNDMARRVLKRGAAVFAPQLLLWNTERFGNPYDRPHIDRQLKQTGGSLTALDLYRIERSIDYLITRKEIDAARVSMIGLSYGGFYTLYAAALDLRIKAAYSSCFFNNRYKYDNFDWTWTGSAQKFMDAETARLICPRPLYIEVGKTDPLFHVRHAEPEAKKVRAAYDRLGLSKNFIYSEFAGVHEFDKTDRGLRFLFKHL